MKSIFLLLFCSFLSGHWAQDVGRSHTESPEVITTLRDLKDHVTRLENRLEDQDSRLSQQDARLSKQERTIQDQNARLSKQESVIQNQNTKLSNQERTIQDQNARLSKQESVIQDQNARLSQQEQAVLTQQNLLQQQKNEFLALFTQQEEAVQQQKEEIEQLQRTLSQQLEHLTETSKWQSPPLDTEPSSADAKLPAKRSDDAGPLEAVVGQVSQQVTEMSSDIQALKNANDRQDRERGTTYIRWGHAGCPASSEFVYTGAIGGTYHRDAGGAANHLCLTSTPVLDTHVQPSGNGYALIYGSEYEVCPEAECNTTPACAVCRVARATVMIPGTNTCSPGWTQEYSGYIMAGYHGYSGSSEFICVDSSHGHYAQSSQADNNENTIYYTHVKCGALPCPPYEDDKLLTCTVCSK